MFLRKNKKREGKGLLLYHSLLLLHLVVWAKLAQDGFNFVAELSFSAQTLIGVFVMLNTESSRAAQSLVVQPLRVLSSLDSLGSFLFVTG